LHPAQREGSPSDLIPIPISYQRIMPPTCPSAHVELMSCLDATREVTGGRG
jgi:hypothetical protein